MLRPSNIRLMSEYVAGGRHGLGRISRRARLAVGLVKGCLQRVEGLMTYRLEWLIS